MANSVMHHLEDSETLLGEEGPQDESNRGHDVHTRKDRLRSWMKRIAPAWIKDEVVTLLKLSAPICLSMASMEMLLFIALLYAGRISGRSVELDAAALSASFVNVTAISIGFGLASAADTLCSQAYGYKNYKGVGLVLQRGILILGVTVLPMWAVWLNSESLLLLIHQPPCVARLAGQYMKAFMFSLPFTFLYIMLSKYLQAQGIVWIFVLAGLVSNIINASLNAAFVFATNLGIIGIALSLSTAYVALPAVVIAYVWARGLHRKTWGGWSWESLREWKQFIKLGLPGLLMNCFEWWSAEISFFVTGAISEAELAINSILINVFIVIFMLHVGVGIGVTIRVGNELGAGNYKQAKRASCVAVGVIVITSTAIAIALQASKNHIALVFTNDKSVLEGMPPVIDLATVFVFSDAVQFTLSAILKGMGRQYIGAVVNFVCYYVVGLPVGIGLGLGAHMGALGIWIGISCGNVLQSIVFAVVVARTNWKKEAEKAMKRAQEVNKSSEDNETSLDEISEDHETSVDKNTEDHKIQTNEGQEVKVDEDKDADITETQFTENDSKMESLDLSRDLDEREQSALIATEENIEPVVSSRHKHAKKLKLLVFKGSFFAAGVAVLLASGVTMLLYHPQATYGNYSECEDNVSLSITPTTSFALTPTPVHTLD